MDPHYDIDIYEGYLTQAEAISLYTKIMECSHHFKHPATTLKGAPSKKRNKTIYGDATSYTFMYKGKPLITPTRPWSAFPELKALADRVAETTGQLFTSCVIQIYRTGAVGIAPHRDKEVTGKQCIASISLGATRNMCFERRGFPTQSIPLELGTLCVINPPTNDYWLHSIPEDDTTEPRISIVFRSNPD